MSSERLEQGLVHVYTGKGKGKTSAALGLALRAAGQGLRTHIVFFMKGDPRYGEKRSLLLLPQVSFASFGGLDHVDPTNVKEEEKEQARQALAAGREAMLSGEYDLVILDEINVAVSWKLLDIEDVARLINEKPQGVELVLTGRYAPIRFIELADLVTEMLEIKHPFVKGVLARRGIEY